MTNKCDIYMKNRPLNVILIIYVFHKKRIIICLKVLKFIPRTYNDNL